MTDLIGVPGEKILAEEEEVEAGKINQEEIGKINQEVQVEDYMIRDQISEGLWIGEEIILDIQVNIWGNL